jgi:3-dehydro-L-gulonate 2-dehydrogenase
MLDLMAAVLSGGRATYEIPADPEAETGLSQVFIAFELSQLGPPVAIDRAVDRVIEHLKEGLDPGDVRYPGERTIQTRIRNLSEGVPVEPGVWEFVQSLAC